MRKASIWIAVFAAAFIYGWATSPISEPMFNAARGVGFAIPTTAACWVIYQFMKALQRRRAR